MDLTLIEKAEIDGTDVFFYDGIDFDMIRDHKGEDGFLIFFVDSYDSAAKAWKRQSQIESILDGREIEDLDSEKYQNSHTSIYQTSGNLMPVYEAIKKKLEDSFGHRNTCEIKGSE